ncbi:MAG TPA: Ku protein [Actinomycetota bacterium]|nr:Ku protein [Actinomycetota bacterium]
MPRAMWKGSISFGLVSIPVGVYPATEEKTLRFHQLHAKDHGRIRYKRFCTIEDVEVPYEEIVKGYEYEKGKYVVLTDEDLAAVPVESTRTIDILQFVDLEEIDPIYFDRPYYLVPEEPGIKAYALLRQAMEQDGRVALAKVTFRDKEHLCTLRVKDGAFVLETMRWPDEIRPAEFEELEREVSVRPQEVQMAKSLIDNLTGPFRPEEYRDEYREALLEVIERKVRGEEIEVVPEPEPTKVVDLMEALRASVEATKKKVAPAKKAGGRKKAAAS